MTLTREKIEAMPAGREMDALVADRVLGVEFHLHGSLDTSEYGYKRSPGYSTNIAAAWEVVEHVKAKASWFQLDGGTCVDWAAGFDDRSESFDSSEVTPTVHAETAPLAICRAALLWNLEGYA